MTEVPEAELAQLRGGWELLNKLQNKPEARQLLERSIKVIHPEVETGDDVAERLAKPHAEKFEAMEKQFNERFAALDAREKAAADAQDAADTAAAFSRLEAAGYQPAGIEKIKGLMVDRKIADPEAAAALFDKQNPPATNEQPGWAPTTWSLDSTAAPAVDVKQLFGDTERWADQEAANVLKEMRGQG